MKKFLNPPLLKGRVSRFSACASDDLSAVKIIVFRPIRSLPVPGSRFVGKERKSGRARKRRAGTKASEGKRACKNFFNGPLSV